MSNIKDAVVEDDPTTDPTRDYLLNVRWSPAEKAILDELARLMGCGKATVIRMSVIGALNKLKKDGLT